MATAVSEGVQPASRRLTPFLTVPFALAALGAICLAIDLPVAAFFRSGPRLRFLRELFDNAEPFGHGMGVALIIASICVLDRRRRGWTPALIAGSLGAGLAADALKLVVSRTRPRNLDGLQESAWETFGPFFPMLDHQWGDSQSFPSAHTATAAGFAVILSAMYPQGRWWFFTLAALTGLQRISSSAHFSSDVCFGAAVGFLVAGAVLATVRHPPGTADVGQRDMAST